MADEGLEFSSTEGGGDSREERLAGIIGECSDRLNAGDRIDLDEVIARHPDLAPDLALGIQSFRRIQKPGKTVSPSEVIGGYRILREVGRGGMGVVYEAEEASLGRRVALKVLPRPSFGDERQLERFRREAQSAARLHHPNIVPVFGQGEEDGTHYYAMQFIEGRALSEVIPEVGRVRSGSGPSGPSADGSKCDERTARVARELLRGWPPRSDPHGDGRSDKLERPPARDLPSTVPALPPRDFFRGAARVCLQVAEALAYAHGEGILHRDIKPSNLLLDERGTVWVTDFGLAKAADTERLTRSGDVVGTLAYMAPERFEGWSDPRSDVYSLGLTLYELLTSRPAFEDPETGRLIRKVTGEAPVRPAKLDPRIPRDLETVVLKAMAREPGQRYQGAAQLAEDLRLFLADRPILARRSSGTERAWRWCRRNPALAGLAVSVVVLSLGFALMAVFDDLRLRERLRDSYLAQGQAIRWSGRAGRRFEGLDAIRKAAAIRPSPELRDEAIACLALLDLRVRRQWKFPANGERAFGFDARLERFAIETEEGSISIRSANDGLEIAVLPDGETERTNFVFSPSGRYLAATHEPNGFLHRLRVWDWERRALVLDVPDGISGKGLDFSPDDLSVAARANDGFVTLYSLSQGRVERRLKIPRESGILRFSPEGRRIAVGYRDLIEIHDLETLSLIGRLPNQLIGDMAWSPSGNQLAGTSNSHVAIWDVWKEERQALLEAHQAGALLAFNHRGDLVAVSTSEGMAMVFSLVTGEQVLSLPGQVRNFGPRDLDLGFKAPSQDFGTCEVARGVCDPVPLSRLGAPCESGGLAVSTDGRVLAISGSDAIAFLDLERAREIGYLPAKRMSFLAFEADGTGLLAAGKLGLYRFPLRAERSGPITTYAVGQQECWGQREIREAALFPDGRTIALAAFEESRTVSIKPGGKEEVLAGVGTQLADIAVSPDGRWVASGTLVGGLVKVWEAGTGNGPREIRVEGSAKVTFTPDGSWLVTSTGREYRFWRTGSWEPSLRMEREGAGNTPGPVTFTRDGSMMAVAHSPSTIHLLDTRMFKVLARLEAPLPRPIGRLCFSLDGRRLAATTGEHTVGLQLWDVGQIREQLAGIGLDWGLPHFPPVDGRQEQLRVEITWNPRVPLPGSDYDQALVAAPRSPGGLARVDYQFILSLAEAHAREKNYRNAIRTLEEALGMRAEPESLAKLDEYRHTVLPDLVSYGSIDAELDEGEILIPLGASWRYFPGKSEPSPGLEWAGNGFDDHAWKSGPGGFGYGPASGINTALVDMDDSYTTLYLRREIRLSDPTRYSKFVLTIHGNDGFVAYLNGEDMGRLRAGKPEVRLGHQASGDPGGTSWMLEIEPRHFRRADNLLAIQALNRFRADVSFAVQPMLFGKLRPEMELDGKRFDSFRARASGDDRESRRLYWEGRLLQRAGEHRLALARFQESVQADSLRPEPLYRLCQSLRAAGDPFQAEALLRGRLTQAGQEHQDLWCLWFAVSASDLGQSPSGILASLPRKDGAGAASIRWVLHELSRRGVVRLNSGGEELMDDRGVIWGEDRFFHGGWSHFHHLDDSGNRLCQTTLNFPQGLGGGYRIPLPPGSYRVTLHLIEPYIEYLQGRQFDVVLEAKEVIKCYEPLSVGLRKPDRKSFEVEVKDGLLDIDFIPHAGDPCIAGLEIERL